MAAVVLSCLVPQYWLLWRNTGVVVLPQSGVVGAAAYWFAWVFVVLDAVAVVTVLAVVALLPLAAWRS